MQARTSQPMYPCPEYFIVRRGARQDTMVPLVAADQLPEWLQLAGVPRELRAEQASGLVSLGILSREDDSVYEVCLRTDMIRAILNGTEIEPETPGFSATEKGTEEDHRKKGKREEEEAGLQYFAAAPRKDTVTMTTSTAERMAQSDKPQERSSPRTAGMRAAVATAEAMVRCNSNEVTVSAASRERIRAEKPDKPHHHHQHHHYQQHENRQKAPGLAFSDPRLIMTPRHNTIDTQHRGTKEHNKPVMGNMNTTYCRHWCHHGTCKWGRGCRYQHRMPTSWEGLREIGLKDFPTWYLLVMGAEGFPAGPRRGGEDIDVDMHVASANTDDSRLTSPRHSFHPAEALLSTSSSSPSSSSSRHSETHRPANLSQQYHHQPSPMDLRLMQGRMSALLSGSTEMSNRQKLRQIKEMRELFLRTSNASSRPASFPEPATSLQNNATMLRRRQGGTQGVGIHPQGSFNLYTDENSMVAPTVSLSAAGRRHGAQEEEGQQRDAKVTVESLTPADMIKKDRSIGTASGGKAIGPYGEDDDDEDLRGRLSPACGHRLKNPSIPAVDNFDFRSRVSFSEADAVHRYSVGRRRF
ncbi:hypothetical protein M406DRAFT_350118 [Cryphonectria parasitica EP155]|uniref:C3H1-type domain-containing protein n=1 Tax=Cryphonectria parasitica (strain ATCC 38755 / EP155) TaxID=660469 RepID=A0A9P4YAF7_CRYP1|nr:uncharacterized protein M406DRAFT_350118 [Cryphonectria parasitica EP155]KAF3769242.1 hypothetical protein M406DRAFT_350118 [Cryphonectria parasitica EP155]